MIKTPGRGVWGGKLFQEAGILDTLRKAVGVKDGQVELGSLLCGPIKHRPHRRNSRGPFWVVSRKVAP